MNKQQSPGSLAKFRTHWQACLRQNAEDHSAEVYAELVSAYREPQRVYHSLEHIEKCLMLLDQVKQLTENADALALAIWFHDAIYVPGASDNEKLSAEWFLVKTENQFDDKLRHRVYDHIMATLHCGSVSNDSDSDSDFMVDIDLSSFGMPWPVFLADSKQVRAERPDLDDAEFYRGQACFQKALLERPRFFQSDYFYQHYEAQARKNLEKIMALIEEKI